MTLRPFTWSDLPELVELHNDPAVMHYINNGGPVSHQEVAADLASWIDHAGSAANREVSFGFVAAVDHKTGELLGWFHLRPQATSTDEPDAGAELGFRLRRSAWGRGLATEGSRALVDHGFRDLAIPRVYAHTMFVHWASRRVLEKTGLRLARFFVADWPVRIPGDEYGDVEYVISRTDWESVQPTSIHEASEVT